MTMPNERTRAVQWAADLLRRLKSKSLTPRVPQAIRDEAHAILRHYPGEWDIFRAHRSEPATWGDPEAPENHGFTTPLPADGTWTLKLTDAQIGVVMTALEQYSRIGIGQLNVISDLARDGELPGETVAHEKVDIANKYLDLVKESLFGLTPNASHGILSPAVPMPFKRAWVLYTTLRYATSWKRAGYPEKRDWHTMMGTNYDAPWVDLGEPEAQVEAADTESLISELPKGFALVRPPRTTEDSTWHVLDVRAADNTGAGTKWVGSAQSAPAAVQLAKNLLTAKS